MTGPLKKSVFSLIAVAIILAGALPSWIFIQAAMSTKSLETYQFGWLVPALFVAILVGSQVLFSSWLFSGKTLNSHNKGQVVAVLVVFFLSVLNVLVSIRGSMKVVLGDKVANTGFLTFNITGEGWIIFSVMVATLLGYPFILGYFIVPKISGTA